MASSKFVAFAANVSPGWLPAPGDSCSSSASSTAAFVEVDFAAVFESCPFAFGFAEGLDFGGLFATTFSWVLPDDAAVGLVIRSKKLPSTAAKLLLPEVCEPRDSGRCPAASDERAGGFEEGICGFGLDAREALKEDEDAAVSGSCFAFDEAVGAVR